MEHIIENIHDIDKLTLEPGVANHLIYKTENFEYNLLVYYREKYDNLVVLSNGAVNYERKTPPIFMRSKWAREIEGSLIYVDDATIHGTNLNLGWGQGKSNEFVLRVYSEIVQRLSYKLEIQKDKVCYYGSSAGGFMSILMSTMHTGSFSIVNNPQTDVKNYHEGHSKPLLELSYGSVENAYENYKERVNLVHAFEYYNYVPKIYYIQNQFSHHDLKYHVNPFIKSMKENELEIEKVFFLNYFDKEKGHTPLDKDPAIRSLNLLLKTDLL